MQQSTLKSKSGSDWRSRGRTSHIKPSSSMPRSMRSEWKTSTDTDPVVELQQEQWLMRSRSFKFKKGNSHRVNFKGGPGKTCRKCSTSHPLKECPLWGKKCHKCGNKSHFSTCCRTRDREDSQDRDQHRLTHRESWSKRRSRSRHRRYASEDSEDRSRSRSTSRSAHSIEQNSFQDHPELHERHHSNVHERLSHHLHERHPFECNDFVKKTFHAISRSKLVASISNETDSDGKTKILTLLNIKLPHWNGIDNVSQSWQWCRG